METHWQQPRNSLNDGQNTSGTAEPPHPRHPIRSAETELPISCDKPSKAEVKRAILTLRSGKAAGPDEIPAKAIKEHAIQPLQQDLGEGGGTSPVERRDHHQAAKKGDLRDCSNYRGIMLLWTPGKVLNRVLLERMKEVVDPKLRDQQAGFWRNRSCADQIASLRITVEQSLEWNSPPLHRFYRLWEDLRQCRQRDNVEATETLWSPREDNLPHPVHLSGHELQDCPRRPAVWKFRGEDWSSTGVSAFTVPLSPGHRLDYEDSTTARNNSIQWTLWTQLDDLDFADDLAFLSHNHCQMQDKTSLLETTSAGTGLKINRKEIELMKMNTIANTPVTVGGEPIREVESFVYLGSVVDQQVGSDWGVTARVGKVRAAFIMLKNIWASGGISMITKFRILNSNVKSFLLYGCETWRTTQTMQQKIQTFFNTCLRRIYKIQ